jgi:hypothetical protein
MTSVTVRAGASGEMTEVAFGPESPANGSEAHGAGPSPYGYVLMGLGA